MFLLAETARFELAGDRSLADWNSWKKLKKEPIIDALKDIIVEKQPTVLILQEFELNNSTEPMSFLKWMKESGYKVMGVMPNYKVSMTLLFAKSNVCSRVNITRSKTKLTARNYAIKIEDYIIYGTHVPLNSENRPTIREDFWDDIIYFYKNHKKEKVVLTSDFNTFDKNSEAYKRYKALLHEGAYDLWTRKGNPDNTPTELRYRSRLDYIFISPSVEDRVVSMTIDPNTMEKDNISDHAALILELL